MDRSSASFDWNQVRAFLATAEEGSLSAAARTLGQAQPTIGRQVTALEEDLGITLFERVGRSLELTEAGAELLTHVQAMGDAARRVSLVASGQSQTVEGRVTITASDVTAAWLLPPILSRIRAEAPDITIDVVADNGIRNLQRREADIAIRHVRPDQPELIAKLVGEATARLYAHRKLLDAHDRPQTLAEVAQLPFVGLGNDARLIEEFAKLGLHLAPEAIRATSDDGNAAWAIALGGLGVCAMADAVAAKFSEMEVVCPDFGPIRFPVWLAVHRELRTSRRIRLVYDILDEELRTSFASA